MPKKNILPKTRDPNWKDLLETKSGPMRDKKKQEDKDKCRSPVKEESKEGNMNKVAKLVQNHLSGVKTAKSKKLMSKISNSLKKKGYKAPFKLKKVSWATNHVSIPCNLNIQYNEDNGEIIEVSEVNLSMEGREENILLYSNGALRGEILDAVPNLVNKEPSPSEEISGDEWGNKSQRQLLNLKNKGFILGE